MSEPDPIRWVDNPDAPPGMAELVRSMDGPPPLPPAIRHVARPRSPRLPKAPVRWIAPGVMAAAVVIGGLVLWRFHPSEQAAPAVTLAPIDEPVAARDEPLPIAEALARAAGETPRETPVETLVEAAAEAEPADEPGAAPEARAPRIIDPVPSASDRAAFAPPRPPPAPTLVASDDPFARLARSAPDDGAQHESPPAASGQPGFLSIATVPWSRVWIDGRDTGHNTPIVRLAIPAGAHDLLLVTADGVSHRERVEIVAGEQRRVVYRLAPEPPPAAPTPVAEPGNLRIQTSPRSRVFVDGRDTGRNTPVQNLRVPAGHHAIDLRTDDGTMHRIEVNVAAGETSTIVRRLDGDPSSADPSAGTGLLTINTMPWAHVFVDGRDTHRNTPVRNLPVPAGSHTIGLRTDDGTMHTVRVRVRAGETERIVRQLDTEPARRGRYYDEDE